MPEDGNLLERIRQCDTEALSQVFDDYHDRIYRYVYGYVGRVGPAEDLTANVFFRLLRAVKEGKSPRDNLGAWLYRVAHNLVVDSFRRRPPEELELAEWVESNELDPEHSAEQQLLLDRVRLALHQLTESQQQVVVLKFFEGMDSREVAQIIGKSEGAVDALQHRALGVLRNALVDNPPSGGHAAGSGGKSKAATKGGSGGQNANAMTNRLTLRRVMDQPLLALLYAIINYCIRPVTGAAITSSFGPRAGR